MPEPLLQLTGLHMHFSSGPTIADRIQRRPAEILRAVDGVDLELRPGEALGLVGESGCGKSTVARCIVGLYEPTAGEIRYAGKRLTSSRTPAERRRIQMVFQDPYSSLNPRMTVRQTLGELLRVHRVVPPGAVRERSRELLELVGLSPGSLDAFPRQFSGGQRQRVSIARALALVPELLVADEPISALDVSVQANILNLLKQLRQQLGLSILFIAHNLAVVRHLCDRVAVMYLGRIVEVAETEQLFTDPRHPYTQGLLKAIPRLIPGGKSLAVAVKGDPPSPLHVPPGCRFHPRCPIAATICSTHDPMLEAGAGAMGHQAACHFAWNATSNGRSE
jgi:oligopeptide/dipeptide ABC transporter ATP-binding protein